MAGPPKGAMTRNERAYKKPLLRELAVPLVASVAALVAAFYFDAFERFAGWAERYERWQVDEFVVVPFVLMFVFGWYYWRKSVRARAEAAEREAAERFLRREEARLAEAQRMARLGSWEADLVSGGLSWSDELYRIYGFAPREFVPTFEMHMERIHPDDREQVHAANEEAARGEGLSTIECRVVRPDGGVRVVMNMYNVSLDERGVPVRVTGTVQDVTDRKRAEQALQESEERLRAVVGNVPVVLFALDRDGVFTVSEGRGLGVLGLKPGEVVGLSVFEVYRDVPEILDHARRALGGEEVSATVRLAGRAFDTSYSPVRDEEGEISGTIGVAADVTDRERAEERLRYRALHDDLTGLPNRTLLMDRLGRALSRAGRPEERVAVLFVDLDSFKYVNDSLGHEAGDRLLAAVAGRLRDCLRSRDTAARLGGDEFVILLDGATVDEARRVAERLLGELRSPFAVGGHEVFVTPSIGISLNAAGGGLGDSLPEDLLREADAAMYRVKEEGKAGYRVFDPAYAPRSLERLELESGLHRGLERGEFRVHYQPMVLLKTGHIAGLEALLRWDHPERGLLLPEAFVPLAEETGLIIPIGRWLLQEACRQAGGWRELYPPGPSPTLAVNVSARQLRDPGLAGEVQSALRAAGLDPGRLTLEITEGALVEDEEHTTDALKELGDLGVHFALDDFGTGYSSLSYLKRLPAGLLKLDRTFVEEAGPGAEKNDVLLSGVVGLAHGLGLQVLVEGVETPGQLAKARAAGCDLAQGHLFSEPLPAEAVRALLESHTPR